MTATVLQRGAGRVIDVGPYRGVVLGGDQGAPFLVSEWTLPADAPALPTHIHDRIDEAMLITAGEAELTAGERTVRGGAGTFVHVPRGTVHALANVGPDAVRCLLVKSPAWLALELFDAMAEAFAVPDPDEMARILSKADIRLLG